MVSVPRTTARGGRSPTVETLLALAVVFLVQFPLSVVGFAPLFALTPAFPVTPWTLITSTYSHAGPGHLLSNALVLFFVGLAVERTTTRLRYHAFFIATGAVSGLAQILLAPVTGSVGVLGASGAIFGLLGYLVAGNPLSMRLLDGVDASAPNWVVPAGLFVVGLGLAVVMSGPNSAFVAHLAGLVVGLGAGRARLLHVGRRGPTHRV